MTDSDPHLFGGKYLLETPLGHGGMGDVFRAEQVEPRRTVAIKMLHEELYSDPEEAARFHGEAAAMRRIYHPNVVHLIEEGRLPDGRLYLVMEWADGLSLGDLVQTGDPLPRARAIALGDQVLAGLAEIHAAGVVHGDIKADNAIVARRHGEEHMLLIDFGLARVLESASPHGASGTTPLASHLVDARFAAQRKICGTPAYLAPEVIQGGPITPASDVYAAATLLYELLVGRTPFTGHGIEEILERQVNQTPAPPSLVCRGLAPDVERVILRGLAKRPADRYPDAGAMRSAFAGSLATALRPAARPASHSGTSPDHHEEILAELRRQVGVAMTGGDPDAVIRAYVMLALALVQAHRAAEAIAELEEAVDVATAGEGEAASHGPHELWRPLVLLGQLYLGDGNLAEVRVHAHWALAQAERVQSPEGRGRAQRLLGKLGARTPSVRTFVAGSGSHPAGGDDV